MNIPMYKNFITLTSIDLSFKFSHRRYEQKYCCYYCDKSMKIYCHQIAIKKNKNEIIKRELQCQQWLLKNNDTVYQL